MRFGRLNVRSLYVVVSPRAVASELAMYNIDIVAVQCVRRVKVRSQSADD
jgi:hypothetical protein